MKKLMAMILTLAMVMSLCVVPASAAGSGVTITIMPDKATVDTTTGDAVVTYTVKAKVTDTNLKVGALTIELAPSDGLTLAEKTKKDDSAFYYEANPSLFYHETFSPSGIFDTKAQYAPLAKTFVAAGATSARNLNSTHGEVVLMTIMGKIAQGTTGTVTLGTTVHTYGDVMAEASHNCDVTPATVTISKAPITSVSATVSQPVKGYPLDTSVNVYGATAYTAEVIWKDVEENMTATGDAKPGKIYTALITLKAKEGETFATSLNNTTTPGGYTIQMLNSTELLLTKEFDRTNLKDATSIAIDNTTLTVAVPTAEPNMEQKAELPLTAKVKYDDGTDETVDVSWSFVTNSQPECVKIEAGSKLTVTNKATDGTVEVKAAFNGMTATETVTITKESLKPSAIVATAPATGTNITIPNGGTATSGGNCSYKVYDQYGAEMTGSHATWKMKLDPATVTGVTLTPDGAIAVTNAATTCKATLHAEIGEVKSNEITFNIDRATSVAKSLTIEGTIDSVTVPTVTEPGTTKCEYAAYTAKVLDQYGAEMTGKTIEWSVTDNPGVTINNGQLTVTNAATAGNVTITAKSGNLTATKTVTIHKDAATVSIVRITAQGGETPVTTIICTGSQRLEYYTATVYDQYGNEKQDDVTWSLDPASYPGVNYAISETNNNIVTLKVDPNAAAGPFKLVAASKTVPTVKHELNIEVKKKIDVSDKINFNDGSLPYNGAGQKYEKAALDSSVTAGEGGKWTYTYAVKSGSTGTLDAANLPKTAGTYTVTATYEDSTNVGSKAAVLTIAPKVLHSSDLEQTGGSATKVYDGTATSSITVGVKASSLCGTDTLPINGSAVYNSANVTDANTITFTPAAITTGNYTLAATEKLTITNAKITPRDLTVTPNAGQSKEFGATDPTLTYAYSGEVSGETPAFDGELARDPGENVGTYEIKQGTLKLKDNTSFLANNYELVVASGSKFEITKAASPTLKDITDSQKYTVTSGETAIGTAGMPADAGTLTYAKGTTESTTGTVAIDSWAVDATGKVTYTLSGGAAGDTVTLPVTIGSDNYENSTVNVVITLTKPSSSGGGGGGGVTTYPITVKSAKNGDVTASHKSAAKGTTVTLTVDPDKGYVLDTLTVLDGKDKEIKLTEKNGKYTFTMPASKVTVEAAFKASAPTGKNPFVDVPAGSYYEDAVIWAVGKGITTGTSATTFNPNGICTRAQAVTFLWRAAGSPAAKSAVMPFTDVKAGSYYYDAVLWAVENGITKGTSDTTFSPDATCSRAQIVTFLWRANGSPAVSGNSAFTDVAADAYYAAAVTWAEKNDITGGIGGGLFGSNNNCTRAQIVTFIYRSVK